MKKHAVLRIIFGLVMGLLYAGIAVATASAADIERISKEQLKELLDTPGVMVLDVRPARDWKASKLKIKGSVWEDFEEVEKWAQKYPKDKRIILYCAWPNEHTSVWTALLLVKQGFEKVQVLKGGWNEWLRAGFPVEEKEN